MRNYLPILILCLSVISAFAQKSKKKWDVANPPGEYKEVEVETNEGTWMNLDISPNGQTIAFDMMGDIYTMPITSNTTIPCNND